LPSEPIWLPLEAATEVNRTLVAMTGERHLLRDRGLLDSALARPQDDFVRVIRPFVVPVS
jgi:hypothetical protein